jgi:gliding motility-associated-like protein
MRSVARYLFVLIFFLAGINISSAQLIITNQSNAQALVQKLLGQGVQVSNIVLTGDPISTGFFNNISGTNIGIDSGIALTNGRAKTLNANIGLDGNGATQATAILASTQLYPITTYSGDADLANLIGVNRTDTHDACILEFDFVPLGDTIRFNYVFSSEEYPDFVCNFNDAFAFFIDGPGIIGRKNIAIVPGTNAPVTINNINDVPGCGVYPQYYVKNYTNVNFTHNGHTKILTAISRVQPCETYHLKMVIADVGDGVYDSGVFIEAGSLSSNVIRIVNQTQTDPHGNSYLVEGCATGSFNVKRPFPSPSPLLVSLSYGGIATNGVDVQLLPSSVIIPANDTMVTVNVVPIIDNITEGPEDLVIYALAGCPTGLPTDSTIIQIRDYDILGILPDTATLCKNQSIQLVASTGYSIYQWDANPTLSSLTVRNPIAAPVSSPNTYVCTAIEGTCNAKDSSFIRLKYLQLISKQDVNCHNASTGQIIVATDNTWVSPVTYSINNLPYQAGSTFSNLPVGTYTIRAKDINCIDSIVVNIIQAYPDLIVADTTVKSATCSGNPDGRITLLTSGGSVPYNYSLDGINYQAGNYFDLTAGNYTVTVKDNNGCTATQNVLIPLDNIVTVEAGPDFAVCEGKSRQINMLSNGNSFSWSPSLYLDNNTLQKPTVSFPLTTIKYFVTATIGICTRIDSVTMFFNAAPVADAGSNTTICFGNDVHLSGSGGTLFRWSPNTFLNNANLQNPTSVRPANTITYYLNVAAANGCVSLQKGSVTITVIPEAKLFAGNDTVIAMGQPLPLQAVDVNHSGFNTFLWSPSYGLSNPFVANPLAIVDHDINYTVIANTANGCTTGSMIKIKVYKGPEIYVPTAFTPNGDGLNDVLRAKPVGMRSFSYFRIYNRWGQPVFVTSDPQQGWDGSIKGVMQSTGTYMWMAEATDYKGNIIQRKGSVTIIR